MSNNQIIQTGINNISNEWFRANIDRKTLKNLSKRTDYEGWKHIIIFTLSLTGLAVYQHTSGKRGGLYHSILHIVCSGVEQMLFGMSAAIERLLKHVG